MCVTIDSFFIDIATLQNQPEEIITTGSMGTLTMGQVIEEPDELKVSSPVLKPSGGGDSVA